MSCEAYQDYGSPTWLHQLESFEFPTLSHNNQRYQMKRAQGILKVTNVTQFKQTCAVYHQQSGVRFQPYIFARFPKQDVGHVDTVPN